MKLARALSERANLNNTLASLLIRIESNAQHLENSKPAEDANELLEEYYVKIKELEMLVNRINHTNETIMVDGVRFSDLLRHQDILKQKIKSLKKIADSFIDVRRYKIEEQGVIDLDVKEIRKVINQTAKEYRDNDEVIQTINWSYELS